MWLWTSQCGHSTLVPVSDRVCRQRSVPYQPAHVRAGIGRCPEQPSLVPLRRLKERSRVPAVFLPPLARHGRRRVAVFHRVRTGWPADMSVFRFIRGIAEGKPVTVYGDDTQQPVREPPQLRC